MNNPNNILFYSNSNLFGGAEKYLIELTNFFNKKCLKKYIFTNNNKYKLIIENNGGEVIQLPIISIIRKINNEANVKLNVNLSNMVSCLSFLIFLRVFSSIKFNLIVHDTRKSKFHVLVFILYKYLFLSRINFVICSSNRSMVELVCSYPFLSHKIRIIHLGIDQDKIIINKILLRNNPIYSHKITIGCISRLEKDKGIDLLINAANQLLREREDLLFMIIGDGSKRNYFEKTIKDNHLTNNFLFIGNVKNVYDYINESDIVIGPSLSETFGLSIAESIILRKPVILSNNYGISEILKDGYNSIVINNINSKNLYLAILNLLQNENLRNSICNNTLDLKYYLSMKRYFNSFLEFQN